MVGLPESRWLSLSEAAAFIAKRCQCAMSQAQDALRRAGREGAITARGIVPLNASSDDNVAWRLSKGRGRQENLDAADWAGEIDWKRDKVGRSFKVIIDRSSLERWLSSQETEDGQSPSPDSEDAVTTRQPIPSPPPPPPPPGLSQSDWETYQEAVALGLDPGKRGDISRAARVLAKAPGTSAATERRKLTRVLKALRAQNN